LVKTFLSISSSQNLLWGLHGRSYSCREIDQQRQYANAIASYKCSNRDSYILKIIYPHKNTNEFFN